MFAASNIHYEVTGGHAWSQRAGSAAEANQRETVGWFAAHPMKTAARFGDSQRPEAKATEQRARGFLHDQLTRATANFVDFS